MEDDYRGVGGASEKDSEASPEVDLDSIDLERELLSKSLSVMFEGEAREV